MEREELLQRERLLLNHLSDIPRQILRLHGQDNVTEFVLHELCSDDCFKLERAAYFVDNPDFDCLKGIAGFCRIEAYPANNCSIWDSPAAFSMHMQKSAFNQLVRTTMKPSMKRAHQSDEEIVGEVGKTLGFKDCEFLTWDSKHNNHDILIFERSQNNEPAVKQYLHSGLSLLSFCPVF